MNVIIYKYWNLRRWREIEKQDTKEIRLFRWDWGIGTDLKMTPDNLEKGCILSSMGLILLKEDMSLFWMIFIWSICWSICSGKTGCHVAPWRDPYGKKWRPPADTQWGTKNPSNNHRVSLDLDLPVPLKPLVVCNPSEHLDYNFMRDLESEQPSQAARKFLQTLWDELDVLWPFQRTIWSYLR